MLVGVNQKGARVWRIRFERSRDIMQEQQTLNPRTLATSFAPTAALPNLTLAIRRSGTGLQARPLHHTRSPCRRRQHATSVSGLTRPPGLARMIGNSHRILTGMNIKPCRKQHAPLDRPPGTYEPEHGNMDVTLKRAKRLLSRAPVGSQKVEEPFG